MYRTRAFKVLNVLQYKINCKPTTLIFNVETSSAEHETVVRAL